MDALKAEGVCRAYGKQAVLKGFSLALPEGGFHALMGPSGSGKSTFLHLAAGLLKADRGTIEIGGRNVVCMGDDEAARFRRRHVGVVFQEFNLLPDRSVRDNILLPARLDGAKVDESRFEALVGSLGIAAKAQSRPDGLSGGERQRVAIARALYMRPEVVLADEPTGNLDARAARDTCEALKAVNAAEKSAILVVTHDPVVAACADTVHFLRDGAIAASFETNGDPALVSRLYLETCR